MRANIDCSTKERARDILKPAQMFAELDVYLQVDPQGSEYEKNDQIGRHLKCAMRGFVAQWLPLVSHAGRVPSARVNSIVLDSWRAARREMLKVLNRVSYRSVLALYLFSQTPIPVDVTKEENMDGISGSACLQMALSQVQELRTRHKTAHKEFSISQDSLDGSRPNSCILKAEFIGPQCRGTRQPH
jgi:hypothetical protein